MNTDVIVIKKKSKNSQRTNNREPENINDMVALIKSKFKYNFNVDMKNGYAEMKTKICGKEIALRVYEIHDNEEQKYFVRAIVPHKNMDGWKEEITFAKSTFVDILNDIENRVINVFDKQACVYSAIKKAFSNNTFHDVDIGPCWQLQLENGDSVLHIVVIRDLIGDFTVSTDFGVTKTKLKNINEVLEVIQTGLQKWERLKEAYKQTPDELKKIQEQNKRQYENDKNDFLFMKDNVKMHKGNSLEDEKDVSCKDMKKTIKKRQKLIDLGYDIGGNKKKGFNIYRQDDKKKDIKKADQTSTFNLKDKVDTTFIYKK